MVDRVSYREFMSKLDDIHKDITDIKVQTTKTNGRVTACEHRHEHVAIILSELQEKDKSQDEKIWRISAKVGMIVIIIMAIIYVATGQVIPLI